MKTDGEAAESFAQYLKFWLNQLGINPREAEARAASEGAQVSNSKIGSALNGFYADHRMRIIEAVALAIDRPPEEVFLAALGYCPPLTEYPEFKESDAAHLWHLISQCPAAERKIYNRYLRMLADDLRRRNNRRES